MENFCKGVVFGVIAGLSIGAISVAKNKNLQNTVKENTDKLKKKMSSFVGKIKEKLDSEPKCNCECQKKQVDEIEQEPQTTEN